MLDTTAVLDDRYELGPVLGRGGMARVYRGRDRTLDRPVAVKVLAEPYAGDRGFVARFRREAHAAARLNHPNIVSVFDSGSDSGTHYIVMELVDGRTLSQRLKREGPVPPEEGARIGVDVARALGAAHERGVIHRDIKPGNVMMTTDGRVKVVDFGIARASGAEDITRSGLVLGSASYLSPEQAQGASGDERSDLYGLGCVMYEMLTGRPPFVGDDPIASLYQHVNEQPAPPSFIRPMPEDLQRVVLRCLEKDPARRFASANLLEAALLAASVDGPTSTMPLPAVAGEPTAPVARVPVEPTAPVARVPVEPTAPVSPRPPVAHRRRPSRQAWWIAGAAAGLLLIAGAALLLADPLRLPSRAELREAREEARAAVEADASTTESPTVAPPPVAPPTVDEAYTALLDAINAAASAGEIVAEDITAELVDETEDVKRAYDAADFEEFQTELGELLDYHALVVEEGLVSPGAGTAIGEALEEFILALESVPLPEATPSDEGEEGHGGGDGGDD